MAKKKKGKIFTIENAEKLVALVNSGKKVAHAAVEIGIKASSGYGLMSWARRNDSKIKIKTKKPKQSNSAHPRELRLKMFEMYHSGESYEAIEIATGVSPKTIYSIIRNSHFYVRYFNPPIKLRKCHNPMLKTMLTQVKAPILAARNFKASEKSRGLPSGWANLLP